MAGVVTAKGRLVSEVTSDYEVTNDDGTLNAGTTRKVWISKGRGEPVEVTFADDEAGRGLYELITGCAPFSKIELDCTVAAFARNGTASVRIRAFELVELIDDETGEKVWPQ